MDRETTTSYSTLTTRNMQEQVEAVGPKVTALRIADDDESTVRVNGDVLTLIGEVDGLSTFNHPVLYGDSAIIDGRPFVNRAGELKNNSDYSFMVMRARVELRWSQEPDLFIAQAPVVTDVFSAWISNGLAMRYNMPLDLTIRVKALIAIYFYSLLHSRDIDESEVPILLLKFLPRNLRMPAQLIEDVISDNEDLITRLFLTHPSDKLPALITGLNAITQDAFDIDSVGLLNSVVRGSYVGANAAEVAAVAIEHPPLFFLLTLHTSTRGIQSRTGIGRAVGSVIKRHDGDAFTKYMSRLAR